MSYNPLEQKAIKWYGETHNCRVSMSTKNKINFQKKDTQEFIECDLTEMIKEYTIYKNESDREARRVKQAKLVADKRNLGYKEQYR